MLRVGVLFGGRSGEHDVSLMSAESVMSALDRRRYQVVPIGIGRDGSWWTGDDCLQALRTGRFEGVRRAVFVPEPGDRGGLFAYREDGSSLERIPLDVVFPVLHGPYGEDGTVQGLLELAAIAYVGCGVAASAVGMDKGRMKRALAAANLPQVEYRIVPVVQWQRHPDEVKQAIAFHPGFPCFVKPASLGSSVGVYRVDEPAALSEALAAAAELDHKVIVEAAASGFREIEVGVLGNDDPQVSVPGEVIPARPFYDYKAKYGDPGTRLLVPAPVKPETARRLQDLGRRAFEALGCSGLARVDFFVSPDEETIFVNEVNTMPGFTRMSMYPKAWIASGLSYETLVDRLIELALESHREKLRVGKAQESWRPPE